MTHPTDAARLEEIRRMIQSHSSILPSLDDFDWLITLASRAVEAEGEADKRAFRRNCDDVAINPAFSAAFSAALTRIEELEQENVKLQQGYDVWRQAALAEDSLCEARATAAEQEAKDQYQMLLGEMRRTEAAEDQVRQYQVQIAKWWHGCDHACPACATLIEFNS